MLEIVYNNNKFLYEIEYVFDFVCEILGVEYRFTNELTNNNNNNNNNIIIIINYSDKEINKKNAINIYPAYLFSDEYLNERSIPYNIEIYDKVPIVYVKGKPFVKYDYCNNIVNTNIDIIQSIFFMLTRYEEIVLWDKIEKDLYGRFPAKESIAYKNNFLQIPIVNIYINMFWEWLKSAGYKDERRIIFEKDNFAACLTHDVDMPFKYNFGIKRTICNLKKTGHTFNKFKDVVKHSMALIDYHNDPNFTFDYIRKVEKNFNSKSSFYFMSGGNYKFENYYDINDKRIIDLIRGLEKDNCEVGYHYSFYAHNNIEMRKQEKEKLDNIFKSNIYGGRNHFLRFTPLESWRICERVGMLYDSTLSYADYNGFRCGTSYPYKTFDIKERRIMNLWEIPLIIMESTLKDKKYRNMSCNEGLEEIKKTIDIVRKYGGIFTLLWHNSSFDKSIWKGWKLVFEETMKYLYINNIDGFDGKKIIEFMEWQELK